METRDSVARALIAVAILFVLLNIGLTAYVFIVVRRVVTALSGISG